MHNTRAISMLVLQTHIGEPHIGEPCCFGMGCVEAYTKAATGPSLHVCYQRHAYGLGEHYNSVVPGQAEDTEEEGEVEEEGGNEEDGEEQETDAADNPYEEEEVTGNKTKAAANQAKAIASLRKKKGRDSGGGRGTSRAGVFI